MRRHSCSAPARLSLDRLEAATENLGRRVLSLSRLVPRSSLDEGLTDVPSLVHQPVNSLVNLVVDTMVRTCHGCHGPLDEDHQEYPSGWQKCQLEHWDGCQGGIAEGKASNGSDWRGCPLGYVYVESIDDGSGSEVTEDSLNKHEITLDGDDKDVGRTATQSGDSGSHTDLGIEKPHDVARPGAVADLEEDPDLLQQLEAANILLKKQVKARDQQASEERDRKVAILKAENEKLAKSMNGDIGGARVKDTQLRDQLRDQLQPHPKNRKKSAVGESSLPSNQEHLTRNRLRASEYRPEDKSTYSGLDIKGIRKIPDLQAQVDMLIGAVQHLAPSLDSRPSFVLDQGVLSKPAVPVIFSARNFSTGASTAVGNDPETSSDEDFDEAPRPGFVFKWRRDATGEKYNVEEKVTVRQEENVDLMYRYVRDEATGRSYKKLVLRDNPEEELVPKWVVDPDTGKRVKMLVPSQQKCRKEEAATLFTNCQDNFTTPLPLPRVKTPQMSSSAPARTAPMATLQEKDEKQGKMPSIVSYARNCPVSWTSKITSDKLNMGLWCWAFISELLATRTGQAPTLQHGELEARLKHFLNVLEIALQPSSPSEFDTHAWRVARLYADKVQQKVERGDTWLGFESRYGGDSQPHELMAAERELAARIPKKREKEEVKNTQEKKSCTTWNTSSVEGKCEYEVQNEGRSCSRRHECTWCKEKGKRSLHHQRSFCRQRIASGDQ